MQRLHARVSPAVLDGLLAVFFTVLAQVELRVQADDGYKAGPLWLNTPLELLCTLPLLVRSTRPRLALALMGTALAGPALFVGHTLLFWGNFLPLMMVNYTVARTQRGWLGRWSWLVCTAIGMVFALHMPELRTWSTPVFPLVMFGATSAAGLLVRRLSEQRTALANALTRLAAEQSLREEAAAGAERRRIAAEMHDVVAHAVSLMTMQVGAARLELESTGGAVPSQLRAAEDTGRRAVDELRRTLGVLRQNEETGALEPLPGVETLPALVPLFAAAGVPVTMRIGATGDLPASMQLAAYRIVQEALTNVVKHAGHVAAVVEVDQAAGQLTVRVRNSPGRSPGSLPGGHGLAGMRERVAMFGGTVEAGTTPEGGFEVRAVLPVPDAVDAAPSVGAPA
ncbi:MAG: sensor histidine kinase [Nocardioidaceae bacterium]